MNFISEAYNELSKEEQDVLERFGLISTGNIAPTAFKTLYNICKRIEALEHENLSN